MSTSAKFVRLASSLDMPSTFNPYRDICPFFDSAKSPKIRRRNLQNFIDACVEIGCDGIWFGRDLGYRGGRRTGVALTDEYHLPQISSLCDAEIKQATVGSAMSERTATVVWKMIREIGQLPFLWNIFPLHPHPENEPLGNRAHTRKKLGEAWKVTECLLELLQPEKIVAIGGDAHTGLLQRGIECEYVRHPSYGGQADFISGLRKIYPRKPETNKAGLNESLALLD